MARVALSGAVELTDDQRLYLRVSAAEGGSFFRLRGAKAFAIARGLERRGLGEVHGAEFRATPLGVDAVTEAVELVPRRTAPVPVMLDEADLPF